MTDRKEYMKAWRAAKKLDPEWVARKRLADKSYYVANAERCNAADKARREAKREQYSLAQSESRKKNRAKETERYLRWVKANPDKHQAIQANRRKACKLATTKWDSEFDDLVVREAHSLRIMRNKLTSFRWEVDHIVPLVSKRVCGLHNAYNLRVIPEALNRKKSNLLTSEITMV